MKGFRLPMKLPGVQLSKMFELEGTVLGWNICKKVGSSYCYVGLMTGALPRLGSLDRRLVEFF